MSAKTNRFNAVNILIMTMLVMNIFSYLIGREYGYPYGQSLGSGQGQVELVIDIGRSIGETVDCETDRQTYQHFIGVKNLDLYIIEKNGVKTLATWKYLPDCYESRSNAQ